MEIGTEPFELILLIIMVGSMIVASELKKLYQVAIAFIVFMLAISGLYWILGSPAISVFQLSVYAGTTGVILFASISVFPTEEELEQEKKGIKKEEQ